MTAFSSAMSCRYARDIAGVLCIILWTLVPACTKSVPDCDDGKAVTAVINSVSQSLREDLSAVAAAPGMALTDEEWKLIRAGMIIDLEDIREQSFDKDTGIRKCAATLMIQSSGSKERIPLTYIPRLNQDTGNLAVAISGMDEYRQSLGTPELIPEE